MKFYGSKRSNFAGDRQRALLERVSMHEAVRTTRDNHTPASATSDKDARALGPLRVAGDGYPRRCRVSADAFHITDTSANATCFKGVWLAHHRTYIGAFLYVSVTNDATQRTTRRIGSLDAVFVRDDDENSATTILLKLYEPNGDCPVTALPFLKRSGEQYEYVTLAAGVVINYISVASIGGVLRWNERVPPLCVNCVANE